MMWDKQIKKPFVDDLDELIGTCTKLPQQTAGRAKPPNRRPPSNHFLKENVRIFSYLLQYLDFLLADPGLERSWNWHGRRRRSGSQGGRCWGVSAASAGDEDVGHQSGEAQGDQARPGQQAQDWGGEEGRAQLDGGAEQKTSKQTISWDISRSGVKNGDTERSSKIISNNFKVFLSRRFFKSLKILHSANLTLKSRKRLNQLLLDGT